MLDVVAIVDIWDVDNTKLGGGGWDLKCACLGLSPSPPTKDCEADREGSAAQAVRGLQGACRKPEVIRGQVLYTSRGHAPPLAHFWDPAKPTCPPTH